MHFAELAQAATLGREAFLKRVQHPVLISTPNDDDDQPGNFDTPDKGTPLHRGKTPHTRRPASKHNDETPHAGTGRKIDDDEAETVRRASAVLSAGNIDDSVYDDMPNEPSGVTTALRLKNDELLCYTIEKSNRNPFGQMVTVGRTPNNDIVLHDVTVSKFHAYLTRRGEHWWLHDQGSRNGTFVEKRKIDAKGVMLQDGSRVGLGNRLRFRYYTPIGIYDVLRAR